MKTYHNILLILCCFVHNFGFAQFTKTFDVEVLRQMQVNDQDQVILPGLISANINGNISWSKNLFDPITNTIVQADPENMHFRNNGDLIVSSQYIQDNTNKLGISLLDNDGNIKWSKHIQFDFSEDQFSRFYHATAFFHENKYYVIGSYPIKGMQKHLLSILMFDQNGNLLFHKAFTDNEGRFDFRFFQLNNGNIVLVLNDPNVAECEVLIFDKDFNFDKGYHFDLNIYNLVQNSQDNNILVLAEKKNGSTAPHIVSLTESFDVQWSKFLIMTNAFIPNISFFAITDSGITIKTNDEFFKSDLITLLSFSGDLLQAWRLPRKFLFLDYYLTSNKTKIVYYAFASSFDDNTPNEFVAFHDPSFEDFGCYVPETCLEVTDFEVDIKPISNPFTSINKEIVIEDTGYTTVDFTTQSQDFCPDNFTPIAVPLFSSDDTLCVGETVPLYNLQNVNAESVQWVAPGASSEFSTLSEPSFSYMEAGNYTVTQTVEYAGCFSDFSVDVVVVEPEEVDLVTEHFLCQDRHLTLDVSQNFQADYLWLSDSSTVPIRKIDTPDNYTLEINDRHCTQTFDLQVQDFDFDLIHVPLTPDTSICQQRPVEINPDIDSNASFVWSDGFSQLLRNISESGSYTLTTSLNGCSTSSSIFIQAENCSTELYIPNSFSPNKDGINDDFFPLGNFFEVLDFKIFDRWGDLVHDDPIPWDGTFRNSDSALGVYTYTLTIRNTLLDEEEFEMGDVLLIR